MTVVAQSVSLTVMLVAVLAGIFLNNKAAQELKADFRRDTDRLDKKMDGISQQINGRLDVIEADLRQFYHLSGKHEGRLDAIEKRLG
jgi:hypothetical protein